MAAQFKMASIVKKCYFLLAVMCLILGWFEQIKPFCNFNSFKLLLFLIIGIRPCGQKCLRENNTTSDLSRFRIVEGAISICLKDYETVDHLLWCCERFKTESRRLTDECAAWNSCPGFVFSEEVTGDEVLSGFPWKSWN
jgi:hypothetical protein